MERPGGAHWEVMCRKAQEWYARNAVGRLKMLERIVLVTKKMNREMEEFCPWLWRKSFSSSPRRWNTSRIRFPYTSECHKTNHIRGQRTNLPVLTYLSRSYIQPCAVENLKAHEQSVTFSLLTWLRGRHGRLSWYYYVLTGVPAYCRASGTQKILTVLFSYRPIKIGRCHGRHTIAFNW